jgi:hypothetical protein
MVGPVARVDVGRALGDAAELDGRIHRLAAVEAVLAAQLALVSSFMVWLIRAIASPFGQGRTRTGLAGPPFDPLQHRAAAVNQSRPSAVT